MKALFLDDIRFPEEVKWVKYPSPLKWDIVRNYKEFIEWINVNGLPSIISFDHDLGETQEIWKDVKDYEGIYKVSTLGNVYSYKRNTTSGGILKPCKTEQGLTVILRNNGKDKRFTIHRLVASTFIPNFENKPQINHIDGNRWNNKVQNLEWCTQSENIKHSHDFLERDYTAYGENHKNSLTVSQYSKDLELINVYGSVNEAGRQLKIPFTNIAKCARGERKTAGKFIWKYENSIPTVKTEIKHIINKNYSNRFFIPEEKTGNDCAKWLCEYCEENKKFLPEFYVHSMNPVGKDKIIKTLTSFLIRDLTQEKLEEKLMLSEIMKIQEEINRLSPNQIENLSDGYHTFKVLYEFRKMYNAVLFNEWAEEYMKYKEDVEKGWMTLQGVVPKYNVHKSLRHSDGELCFGGGWFIVVAMLPTGQISNHYKIEDWDLFKIPETEKAKYPFDGHTSKDVLERLRSL